MWNAFKALSRHSHLAVPMDNYIIGFGGTSLFNHPQKLQTLWLYNLYTEAWDEHSVSLEKLTEQ